MAETVQFLFIGRSMWQPVDLMAVTEVEAVILFFKRIRIFPR